MLRPRQLAGRVGQRYRSAVVRRTTGSPAAPGEPDEVAAAVEASAGDLERLLVENVVPFWLRVVDEGGGFHLSHDIEGRPLPAPTRFLVGQARLAWWFARLARTRWGSADDAARARHGFAFLRDRLWDDEHGGFFWSVPTDGGPPAQREKEVLAQSYGLFALTELGRDDPEAAALARELWRLLDERCHDGVHGGWAEIRAADWSPTDRPGPFTTDTGGKSLGVQLHLLEALSPFVATIDRSAADRLLELVLLLAVTMGRTPERPGHGRFLADWRPAPGFVMRQYGHDVELQWMLEEAEEVLGLPPAGLQPLLRDTLDDVLRYGFDHRRGGFYWTGYVGRTAHKTEKEYWTQAEGLLAALRLYRRTGDLRYGRCYLGTLDWIVRFQADWEHGDWHHWVDDRGRGTGDKSGEWKDPYHQGRALLDCLELLRPT